MLQRFGAISPRNQRLLLALVCAVLFGVWLMRTPLVEVDETRYVESTREMFESGNFIIPHFNYTPRYQKPILYYWVQSASVAVFGQHEFAVRLPSALLGLGLVLLLHAFLLRLFNAWSRERGEAQQAAGRGAALLAAAGLATLPLFAPWTRVAITDITLTFFISGALLALLLATIEPQHARRWYLWAAAACGLAFLTKGPIGLAVPGLVWLVYHLRQRGILAELRRMPWALGIFLILLINLPWYVITYFTPDGQGFLRHFFMQENAGRFAEGTRHFASLLKNFAKAAEFLLGTFALLFPYNAFILREATTPFFGQAELRQDAVLPRVRRFAWTWVLVVAALFTCSQTRNLNYAQSISAGVAILFAIYLLGYFTREPAPVPARAGRAGLLLERGLLLFFGLVWFALPVVVLMQGAPKLRGWELPFPYAASVGLLALFTLAAIGYFSQLAIGWLRRDQGRVIAGVMGSWAAFLAVLLIGLAPLLFSCTFGPAVPLGAYLRDFPRDEPLAVYMTDCTGDPENPENLVYYARRHVAFYSTDEAGAREELVAALRERPSTLLVTDWLGLATLQEEAQVEVLKRFDFFIVARVTGKAAAATQP